MITKKRMIYIIREKEKKIKSKIQIQTKYNKNYIKQLSDLLTQNRITYIIIIEYIEIITIYLMFQYDPQIDSNDF